MSEVIRCDRKDTSNQLGPVRSLKVLQKATPHWKRFVSPTDSPRATAKFEIGKFCSMEDAFSQTILSIDTEESYESESGKEIAKRTMVSFDEATTRKLYEMLKEHFEK